jgi:copper chaperone
MKKQITIEGMSCRHCVRHVEEALKGIPGVDNILVNLQEKNAVVEVSDKVTDKSMKQAVEEVGYRVTAINEINLAKGCESCGR